MQVLKGIIAGAIVGIPLSIYMAIMLDALPVIAVLAGFGIGLSIFAVVATRTAREDAAADLAWRAASPDLPPESDRRELEVSQSRIAGPESGSPRILRSNSGSRGR